MTDHDLAELLAIKYDLLMSDNVGKQLYMWHSEWTSTPVCITMTKKRYIIPVINNTGVML